MQPGLGGSVMKLLLVAPQGGVRAQLVDMLDEFCGELYVVDHDDEALAGLLPATAVGRARQGAVPARHGAFSLERCDLVLLCLDGSGLEGGRALIEGFHAAGGGNAPAILAVVGGDALADRAALFRCGVDDYVAAPLVREELLARIFNLVGRHRSFDDARRARRQDFDRVLLQLARSVLPGSGRLQQALEEIAGQSARTLDAEASIWLLDAAGQLRCVAHGGTAGEKACECACPVLADADFPDYFGALKGSRVLSVNDAAEHPATRELSRAHLAARDIVSLLDTPIRQGDRLLGVVCHEHRHLPRVWTVDEEAFAAGVGEQVARVLAAHEHWCANQELHLAKRVMQLAPVSILITDAQRAIVFVNEAFEQMSGYLAHEVMGQSPRILSSGMHGPDFYEAMWQSIDRTGFWQGEIWDRRKSGERYPKSLMIKRLANGHGETSHYVGLALDVSVERAQQSQIEFLAYHDSLTGLANRSLFADRLRQAVARAERNGSRVAVLYLDVDRFKVINDSFGHEAGDRMLKEVAQRIHASIRDGDTLCRQGGDEFLVIVDDVVDVDSLSCVARRILDTVSLSFEHEGRDFSPTLSMGISIFPDDARDESELVKNADMAMYQAKDSGRNRYQFFTAELNRITRRKAEIESSLRSALAVKQGLFMVYQPKIALESGALIGYEALVRWSPSAGTLVPPALFIEIAEESHQIVALGDWIIDMVLDQVAHWQRGGCTVPPVAINVSPVQLRYPGLVERLAHACDRAGVDRRLIEIEITESVFVGDIDAARGLLQQVKAAGFKLTLDDFGTGYSSFSYIAMLPFDAIKVDRSFVSRLGENLKAASVLKAVIALAKELGLELVAEGVETEAQAAWLRTAGAEVAQGYHFGIPAKAADLIL